MSRYVRIWDEAIYEYEHESNWIMNDQDHIIKHRSELTWPKRSGRPQYVVNDCIMSRTMPTTTAAHEFREFDVRRSGEMTAGQFILGMMEMNEVTITYQILSISGRGATAQIVLRPFMKLEGDEVLRIHHRRWRDGDRRMSGNTMMNDFQFMYRANHLATWVPLGRAVMEAALIPFVGIARAGVTVVVGPIVRRYGRRVRRRMMRYVIRNLGQRVVMAMTSRVARWTATFLTGVCLKTVQKTIRAYSTHLNSNRLRGMVDERAVRQFDLDRVVRSAIREAVASQLTSSFTGLLRAEIPAWEDGELMPPSLSETVNGMLTNALIDAIAPSLESSLRAALIATPADNPREYERQLNDRLSHGMSSSTLRVDANTAIRSAFTQVLENPVLMGY